MTHAINFRDELLRKAFDAWENGHLDTAVRIYTQLAQMGVCDAMINLANLCDDHIQPRQPLRAIHWYIKAFRAGESAGAWCLAMHYIPRKNHRWYRFWMAKAEVMGEEDAVIEMAKIRTDPDYITPLPWIGLTDEGNADI